MNDKHPGLHIGVVMFALGFGLLVLLLTWFFHGHLQHRQNPNASLSVEAGTEVVLKRNAFGHYVATGTINGQPVVFLLDTGATLVSVPASLADRLGLKRGASGMSQTANGTVKTWASTLDSVSLGSITQRRVRGSINPGMSGDEVLLGMSFLKHLDLVQRDDVLVLRAR